MKTLREELALAVETARPIIGDGAADDATEADLSLADDALAKGGDELITHQEIDGLAVVAACGIEYLINVDDPDAASFAHLTDEKRIRYVLTTTFGRKWHD